MTLRALSDWDDAAEITVVRRSVPVPAPAAVRVEVDLDAVVANARAVRAEAGVGVLAMLKGDAYGHGLGPVAEALHGVVDGVVVTSVSDALALPGPVLCLAPVWERHAEVLAHGVVPIVGSPGDLQRFAAVGRPAPVHVKIDTGMARLGVREDGVDAVLAALRHAPWLSVAGLCTHLATADEEERSRTERQLETFARVVERFRAAGHRPSMLHAASTAAAWRHPRARLTHVRTGVALFGGDAPSGARLSPALRLVTRIAQLRTLRPGEAVSYGETWRAARPTVVATLPLGYAHGYPRRLAGKAEALVGGRRCPVIGTICMEMMLVDVTEARPALGDEVVLLGAQGDETIDANGVAAAMDGIVEEIFCGLSRTVPREHVRRGKRTLRPVPADGGLC